MWLKYRKSVQKVPEREERDGHRAGWDLETLIFQEEAETAKPGGGEGRVRVRGRGQGLLEGGQKDFHASPEP